jgi:hypothetical protein
MYQNIKKTVPLESQFHNKTISNLSHSPFLLNDTHRLFTDLTPQNKFTHFLQTIFQALYAFLLWQDHYYD